VTETDHSELPREAVQHRLWVLALVPPVTGGRWISAAGIFAVLLGIVAYAGVFLEGSEEFSAWPVALFFCAILAYIIPIFHYITARTEAAFVELEQQLPENASALERMRTGIARKSATWTLLNLGYGIGMWLLQSWLLTGSFEIMLHTVALGGVDLLMVVMPLAVWLVMFAVTAALIDNARLFQRLSAKVSIDLLDTTTLNPFGSMAVSSTLAVVGAQALFPIMWLGSETDPWTTIPGVAMTTVALVYLFAAPIWPVHKALRAAKQRELKRLRSQINATRQAGHDAATDASLTPLLVYRQEIANAAEWPFDISIVARFGLYLVIVPLTWIGAALIENLVDLFIET